MNEKQNRQKQVKRAYSPFVGLLAAGVASYLAALCYLPTSGIFSTLPAAAVLALAASVFCREKWELYALMGVMPCAVTSLLGFSPKRAIFVGIACVFQSAFALLAKRAFLTYRKGRAAVKKKEPSCRHCRDALLPVRLPCRFRKSGKCAYGAKPRQGDRPRAV